MSTQTGTERSSFQRRLKSMLKTDCRRLFSSRLLYILVGCCFVMPILVLVMTSAMNGTVTVDPNTGVESVVEVFKNTWQIIGTVSGDASAMQMDMTTMCNFNLLYFALAILVALFVSEDFKSGYAKNLFTVRAKRGEYIASKTIVCCVGGVLMAAAFFLGALFGGKIAGLPFEMTGFTVGNLVFCMLAKLFLIAVFVPIFLVASVFAKQKTWLGIVLSFAIGMLLFMMISSMTPLNATLMHAGLCLAGGAMFSFGLGAAGTTILKKMDLI